MNWKRRSLVKRTYRVVVRVAAGVVLSLAALVVLAGIRLMSGPVDLDFLKARIARAVDVPGNEFKPDADRIYVEWGGLSQPIRLVFDGLRVTNLQNHVVARVPSAWLSFDPRTVLRGMLLPTAVVVERPTIEAEIAREGGMLRRIFAKSDASSQSEVVGILIEQLLQEPNHRSLLGQLDSVSVEHARLVLRDENSGVTWVAPAAKARLTRDAQGVIISASARFSTGKGEPIDVSMGGVYARDRSRIWAEANIDGIKPSMFADLSPDVALLRGIDIALSGRLRIEADGKGDVRQVAVEIFGGNGKIVLPGILPVAHRVKAVSARASVDALAHTAKLERISVDFGAATIVVVGNGARTADGQLFNGRAEVLHIPVDDLADYWPQDFAIGGRSWALANLSKGDIDVAAEFALSTPDHDLAQLKLDNMVSLIDYRGMTVRYMPHMPELQGVSGTARYEGGNLHFDVASGVAVGLRIPGTTIDLLALDGPPPQRATIHMPIVGSAQDVIRFLARPKLGLPKDVLYDYRRLGGEATIDLSLGFPLINALTVAELDIKAEASLSNFSLKAALGQLDLSDATARVVYGASELNVTGSGKLDGSAVEIGWRAPFGPRVPFRQRYELKGTIPANLVGKAGFPSVDPFVSGPIATTVSYQVATNGTGEVVGRFDLKGATANVPPLDWTKNAGADGQILLAVKLAAGGKLQTIDFEGPGNGLQTKGQVRFEGDNALQQIALQQLRIGQTDVAIDWKRAPGGVELSLRGPSLELPRVRHALKVRDEYAAKDPGGPAAAAQASTKLTLQLPKLLTQRGTLGYVNGHMELAGERLAAADLSIGAGGGSTFRVTPSGAGRTWFFYVADFGAMLRDAGWIDGLVNGYLHIEGRSQDNAPTTPIVGKLKMGPYRLQKVTPRTGVGTLNSAIDGLSRAGNALQQFDGLEADVSKTGDRIEVKNGHTSGPSIGLTAQGVVDLGNDTARLSGVVVPAFALNNMLSNVPVLGSILTGGKNAGLFAVSYQLHGPLDDLKTDVNMMSAVTPGAMRELFSILPDGAHPPPSPESRRSP
jgi:hypothetical protein